MASYAAPIADVLFLLRHVLGWRDHARLRGFAEADLDTVGAILQEAARLAEGVLAPLNPSGDREGCILAPDGSVRTPQGFRKAHEAYGGGGWLGLSADPANGGQGLPYTLSAVVNEFCCGANMAFTMYPGLTQTAIAALEAHASEPLKQIYLPPMIAGAWSGTMNLTEPQCGTDLGLIRTRAQPLADGSYALSGQKIFISSGEHDLTENIVHLVLARIDGAPAGTRGLSLFVAPKFLPGEGRRLGARNGVRCVGLERKMGIHANATCAMAYDGARAWLVGELHRGLPAMFTMMNEARLGVANQGLAISEAACQMAASWARERLQGRALTGPKAPDKPADPLLVHPDVRRMLLDMRAFNQAGRALLLYASLQADIARRSDDAAERERAHDRLGLLTPVLKGVLTDCGFANAVKAQQVFGGHGYVADQGIEQHVRDVRVAMIYEGANGVQALDLVGRKLARDGGRALNALFEEIAQCVAQASREETLRDLAKPLAQGFEDLRAATRWLMENALARPDNAGAAASDYMHLMGLVAMGWMHLRIAQGALAARAADPACAAQMDGRLLIGRYWMERIMPETALRLARVRAGAGALMAAPDEVF